MTHHILLSVLLGYAVVYALTFLVARLTATKLVNGSYVCYVHFNAALPKWLGTTGVTCFGVVWLPSFSVAAVTIAHEYRHTVQERTFFYLGYLPAILVAFALGRGHQGSAMEEDARQFARLHSSEFSAEAPVVL